MSPCFLTPSSLQAGPNRGNVLTRSTHLVLVVDRITLFRSMIMFCGTDIILWNIFHMQYECGERFALCQQSQRRRRRNFGLRQGTDVNEVYVRSTLDLCPWDIGIEVKNCFPLSKVDTIVTSNQFEIETNTGRFSHITFGSARGGGGLVFKVEVRDFFVFFCGGGWTWRMSQHGVGVFIKLT